MTNIPDPYLSPPSQPWGRWVTTTLRNYLAKRQEYDLGTYNAIKQINLAVPQPMRAVLWRQTTGTVAVTTAGVYYPINLAGTLDPDTTFNMAAGTTNVTGLINTTNQARTMVFIASYDGEAGFASGIGLKLALNGTLIDATECNSFASSIGLVGKTMTQFIIRMEPEDEVSMWAANLSTTTDVTVERFKLLAHAVQ
ncbi:hypothetical protein [Planktomarina sp.]|uniref:hypothetical protein n=1 Tax=Planktomarina sp. TaxID=2024851 RepID=UPI003260E951